MVDIVVDGREINARSGSCLLEACLENGIYIPHLCFLKEAQRPAASCRLCFVELGGMDAPVASCAIMVSPGLQVSTDTPAVRRLQRSALKLFLSAHVVDCKRCHANRACALQDIAAFLKVGLKAAPLIPIPRTAAVDRSHPFIDHYPHRCVLCGKCVAVCGTAGSAAALTFCGRGIETVVGHYPTRSDTAADCPGCQRCVDVCPVGALQMRHTSGDASSSA